MVDEYISFTTVYTTVAETTKRTDTDWHLIPLTQLTVAPPPLKTSYMDYPIGSGAYDLSSVHGLKYGNRVGKWQFKVRPEYDFNTVRFDLAKWLHGGTFKVVISSESSTLYYVGRITVEDWRLTERGGYITLGYNLDPFRYDPSTKIDTTFTLTASTKPQSTPGAKRVITMRLTRMPSVPIIYVKSRTGGTVHIEYTVNSSVRSFETEEADASSDERQFRGVAFSLTPSGDMDGMFIPDASQTTEDICIWLYGTSGQAVIQFYYIGGEI